MEKVLEFQKSIKKCLTSDTNPNIDEFSNFALFYKQLVGIILGIIFAGAGISGWVGILLFVLISNLSLVKYCHSFLRVDEDIIENQKIYSESFFPSLVCFIFVWTIAHTAI